MIPGNLNQNFSRIYLWGFMGSGKTTVGKELAKRLQFTFVDLDERLESLERMNVSDIFSQKGQGYFRKLEQDTLRELSIANERIVVATGGGTPCYFDNAEIMNNSGLTVYLEVSPKAIKKRLSDQEISSRPLLGNLDWLEIMDLYKERQIFYSTAEIKVSNEQDVTYCIHKILEQIDRD